MLTRTLTVACAAAILAACSDGTGPAGTAPVTFLVSARAAAAPAAAGDVTVTVGAATMVISSVELVARQIRLRRSGDGCPSDDGAGSDRCGNLRLDPTLLVVPLSGDAEEIADVNLEAGTYDRIQFQIHKPTNSSNDAAFLAANPTWAGISIRVAGSYNGTPFSYTTDLTAVETVNLDAPLVVTEGVGTAVTLHLDVTGWFVNSGSLIDPVALAGSQQLRSRVEQNIRASFKAFRDDNGDGTPQ